MTIADFIVMVQNEYPLDMELIVVDEDGNSHEVQHVTPDFEEGTLELGWKED